MSKFPNTVERIQQRINFENYICKYGKKIKLILITIQL